MAHVSECRCSSCRQARSREDLRFEATYNRMHATEAAPYYEPRPPAARSPIADAALMLGRQVHTRAKDPA